MPAIDSTGTTVIGYTGAIVTFTVQTTGIYDIVAYGAQGSGFHYSGAGGLGAEIGGDFSLTAGETLSIAVGGEGLQSGYGGNGGGGSFVVGPGSIPLVVAGGGGGGGITSGGGNSLTGTAGDAGATGVEPGGVGGTAGRGGDIGSGFDGENAGSGGGGFLSNGGSAGNSDGSNGGDGGSSFAAGLGGGIAIAIGGGGGFGGGGAGSTFAGGGGGGYSGGGGGGERGFSGGGGGGGGSFDGGTNQILLGGENSGDGSVVFTPLAVASTITGTAASQATTDETLITPFASVSITDPNPGSPTETVTVTPDATANGTLLDPNQADDGGSFNNSGAYTVSGTAAAVTAALDGLVFFPTAQQVAPGQTVTTGFTISDTNSAGQTATDSTTTVVATAVNESPVISGTQGYQLTINNAPIQPFTFVAITDQDLGTQDSLAITLTGIGSAATDADGTLSGNGLSKTGTGSYTLAAASPATLSSELDALVFTPTGAPGTTTVTTFTLAAAQIAGGTTTTATDSTTRVTNSVQSQPSSITGTAANQATTDETAISPFAYVAITDPNVGNPTETVTVTPDTTANGVLSDPSAATDGGTLNSGTYSVSGTAAAVTAALQGLVFTPVAHEVAPGQAVTTGFTITDVNSGGQTATDTTTAIIATAVSAPPTISGAAAGQNTYDLNSLAPFANVTVTDTNAGQTETVTVTPSTTANGTLSDPNAATDGGTVSNGVYTVSGTAAQVQAALQDLVFTPVVGEVSYGQAVSTGFTIQLQDTAGQSASDSTTSVVATATAPHTDLASFNGGNGSSPFAGLIADAAGDLFGTTEVGGDDGDGTVFEIAKTATGYASTPTILVSFTGDNGASPQAGLLTDAFGDLFGTTEGGGASQNGTVFEIARTAAGYASTPTTLVSFGGATGGTPVAGLLADAAGDLFGTTSFGGVSGEGMVFEIAKTVTGYAGTPTTLVSFTGDNGEVPSAGLIADAAGDLFGTTAFGGANGDGTVFEIAKTATGYASTPTTWVSFSANTGIYPEAGLIADAAGDVFGTTERGGADDDGTVFEIAKTEAGYASTPTTLLSFNNDDGANPVASLIADAAGDLFGTTSNGGTYGTGTVFEIACTATGYASTPTILLSFNNDHGENPVASLIADAAGNLYGTAQASATGQGVVFEITDTGYVLAPTITGTNATPLATTSEASVTPFASVTITDANAGATDTLTITPSDATGLGTLTGVGLSGSAAAGYTLTGTTAAITTALDALVFTPTAGTPNSFHTTSFTLSDVSSAFATPTTDSLTKITDTDPAVAPTISGTSLTALTTTSEAPVTPFAHVTISDTNASATDTLRITLTGLGTLAGSGLTGSAAGYTLTGTAAAITTELDALVFTPTAGTPNSFHTTSFTLSDTSSALPTPTTDSLTKITDTDPPVAPVISDTCGTTLKTTDEATLKPLSGVSIADRNSGADPSATLTLTVGGAASDANGRLSGAGLTETGIAGIYTLAAASPAILQSELRALVFTPTAHEVSPGGTVTTGLTLAVSDAGKTATNTTTRIVATAVNDAPTLTGTKAGQSTTDYVDIKPFAGVGVTDPDLGVRDSLIITLKNGSGAATDANGALFGAGLTKIGKGTYALAAATPAALSAALDALTFSPTQHEVGAGQTVTTSFVLTALQTAGGSTVAGTDSKTSVVATALNYINGPANGHAFLTGTPGQDVITAHGQYNVILGKGGADIINAGAGAATVLLGNGNASVTLGGGANTVTGGLGNVTVTGDPGGHTAVTLGSGNDIVQLGGWGDTISLGNGRDLVSGTAGMAFITTGSGNDSISLGGSGSTVNAGGGTNVLHGATGTDIFVLPGAALGFDTITGFTETNGDVLDLRPALAATNWNGSAATLGNYVKVTDGAGSATLAIATAGSGAGTTIATLSGSGNLGLTDLISHHSLLT